MEERGYSDFLRNTSEDIVLKSFMENPIGTSSPSMEMLGFKNLSQVLRGDSEELFSSWLMNGEIPGFGSGNVSHRNRQTSRRITTEPSAFASQQNGVAVQKRIDNESFFHQHLITPNDQLNNVGQHSLRNAAEKGMEAGNLYLAKAWFNSNQPMTRSRSSELRRRYAALQNSQTTVARSRLDISNTTNTYDISMTKMPNQLQTFMSPSNSSTCPFNTPPMANGDTVSSVVSMLKGTLEQKKIGNQVDKDTSFGFFNSQEVPENMNSDQTAANQAIEPPRTFHTVSSVQVQVPGNLASMERFAEHSIERCVIPSNQIQMSSMSREPSQSESSAFGFDGCDGPANSGQALSVSESSRKIMGNRTSDHGSKNLIDFRDRVFENNLKNDQKKGSLLRMGSFTSGGSEIYPVDKGDPTKKRRVERSRKMAEAKERNLTPPLPSDMQSVLKRSENLEKEVRSLKLNLSFMNRKDSEQTKQIEELQKQNDELMEEKERLLEEIERIVTEPGRL